MSDVKFEDKEALLAPILYHLGEAGRCFMAASAAGMGAGEVVDELRRRAGKVAFDGEFRAAFAAMLGDEIDDQPPLAATIKRLLDEAPMLPGQAPAIECAVVLMGFPSPISGALSETHEGGLRLLASAETPQNTQRLIAAGKPVPMIEHVFDYDRVTCLVVQRQVDVEVPRVVTS